jgi:aspartate aminotransferase
MKISKIAKGLVGQKMFQILAEAQQLEAQGKDIIHFEIGEPDFDTPQNISVAGINAIENKNTKYVNSMGILELREAACEVTEKSRKFKPSIDQVLVTPGANIQIYLAIACVANPGDEIIIPDPGFVSYLSIIRSLGCIPIAVRLREDNDFELDPEDLKALITDKTVMIIVNSPSNPTGSVINEYSMRQIFDIAKQRNIYLLSDEIYARMVYSISSSSSFFSPSMIDECKTTTIVVNGFSKSYSMTGWRLGVVTGPSLLISKMGLMLETMLSCTPPFIQIAGVEALKGNQDKIYQMIEEYRERRDLLVSGLNSLKGFRCKLPEGAFYVFPNIEETGFTSNQISKLMMEKAGVVVSPGNIFGKNGEGFIRFSYANSKQNINKAIDKLYKIFY